ncbi:MAG: hypothetical protein QG577_1138 [Thermodesulfobacteriota bacterium]|nr:hypothetical protein [Thermodesulfobacteriota bacterium]
MPSRRDQARRLTRDMKLIVTVDVEEEGLFKGQYSADHNPTTNVPCLRLLDELFLEWKIRPTLLLTYQVTLQHHLHGLLLDLCHRWHGELGSHLHHWNTPPVTELPFPDPVPAELVPPDLLAAKLDCLFESFQPLGVQPQAFRMGRFSLGPKVFSLLQRSQVLVDSSVAPLRTQYGGPQHLDAPVDPYFPDPSRITFPGNSRILEVPITIVPVHARVGGIFEKIRTRWNGSQELVGWLSGNVFSLPVQPVWTGLKRLKIATALHNRRGGKVLTLFFHSSELQPGNSPLHPTQDHVQSFLRKLHFFFQWLHDFTTVESLTLSDLRKRYSDHP